LFSENASEPAGTEYSLLWQLLSKQNDDALIQDFDNTSSVWGRSRQQKSNRGKSKLQMFNQWLS